MTSTMAAQKGAKIITLLEELRHDWPMLSDRIDDNVEQLTRLADPKKRIEEIFSNADKPTSLLGRGSSS
jgi:uncharacterized membrane protein